jgi:YhcH/YjgK/YiaL family protein
MICDTIKRIGEYKGLSKSLDDAIDFMLSADLDGLEQGKTEIDGQRIFAAVSAYESKDPEKAQYEAHRRYIDIQIILSGEERIFYLPLDELSVQEEYSAEKDALLFSRDGGSAIDLKPGMFCLLFPQDAHKPGCRIGDVGTVKKAVIKVEVE